MFLFAILFAIAVIESMGSSTDPNNGSTGGPTSQAFWFLYGLFFG